MRISYWSSDVCSSDLTTIITNGRCTTCATGSPRSSPPRRPNRYRPDSSIREDAPMAKWECTICGHIYDEELGDPDTGIAPGTRFEDIPDDWVCPECGAGKGIGREACRERVGQYE